MLNTVMYQTATKIRFRIKMPRSCKSQNCLIHTLYWEETAGAKVDYSGLILLGGKDYSGRICRPHVCQRFHLFFFK